MAIFSKSFRGKIPVTAVLAGAAPATAANYGRFFTADRKYRVEKITEIHRTAGNDAGAVTLAVGKASGTTADGSATTCMTGTFDLKGTAETLQTATLTATKADLILAAGDRLCLVDSGTPTTVADLCVTVILQPLE